MIGTHLVIAFAAVMVAAPLWKLVDRVTDILWELRDLFEPSGDAVVEEDDDAG